MPVTKVNDMRGGPQAIERVGGDIQFNRRLNVEHSNINAGPALVLIDLATADPSTAIGAKYAVNINGTAESYDYSTCVERTAQRDPSHAKRWFVNCTYYSLADGDGKTPVTQEPVPVSGPVTITDVVDNGSWQTERPVVDIDFVPYSETAFYGRRMHKGSVTEDRDLWTFDNWGVIANSATDPLLDPAPERDVERVSIIVERNTDTTDLKWVFEAINSVNKLPFRIVFGGTTAQPRIDYTIPRYGGKVKDITVQELFRGGEYHLRLRYEIEVIDNKGGLANDRLDRSWVSEFLDRGFIAYSPLDAPPPGQVSQGEKAGYLSNLVNQRAPQMEVLLCEGSVLVITDQETKPNNETVWDMSKACYVYYLLYDLLDWTITDPNVQPSAPIFDKFPNNFTRPT